MEKMKSLPIIDISPYLSEHADTAPVAAEIRSVCKNNGFFFIKNHGVPEELQQSILHHSQEFFNLPSETKR